MTPCLKGKIRVYECGCGCEPVRLLHGPPKPCDHCGEELDSRPSRVEDFMLWTRELLERMRGPQ
jgi:hypothetical protein